MVKYYVASRASLPERIEMWKEIRKEGAHIVSSWIDYDGTGINVDFPSLWANIQAEIESCDELIFYAEEDDFPFKGAMVEIGMALAYGKKVHIVLKDVPIEGLTFKPIGSWVMHPSVKFRSSIREAMGLL